MKTHRKARGLRKDDKSKSYVKNKFPTEELQSSQIPKGDAENVRKIEELREDKFKRGIK